MICYMRQSSTESTDRAIIHYIASMLEYFQNDIQDLKLVLKSRVL